MAEAQEGTPAEGAEPVDEENQALTARINYLGAKNSIAPTANTSPMFIAAVHTMMEWMFQEDGPFPGMRAIFDKAVLRKLVADFEEIDAMNLRNQILAPGPMPAPPRMQNGRLSL